MEPEVPDYFESKKENRQKQTRNLFNRRSILRLLTLLSPPIAGLGYGKYEADWIEVSKKTIAIPGINKEKKIKLLHISDLHLSQAFSIQQIKIALHKGFIESPDACFITGDFITDTPNNEELEELCRTLSIFASKIPTYACLGNHDGGSWSSANGGFASSNEIKRILNKAGVRLLVNERVSARIKGSSFQIAGVGDFWSEDCNPKKCLIHRSQNPPRDPVILMCHNPDAKELLKPYFWNLMLAGHTHGGQFLVPFTNYAPFAPVIDKSMVQGLHRLAQNRHMHITRGIGNLYGFRFNCRPEISLLELVSN